MTKEKENELDFIFDQVKGNNRNAIGIVFSFKDKKNKILHYARLLDIDSEIGSSENTIDTYVDTLSSSIKLTYEKITKERLKKDFDFFEE